MNENDQRLVERVRYLFKAMDFGMVFAYPSLNPTKGKRISELGLTIAKILTSEDKKSQKNIKFYKKKGFPLEEASIFIAQHIFLGANFVDDGQLFLPFEISYQSKKRLHDAYVKLFSHMDEISKPSVDWVNGLGYTEIKDHFEVMTDKEIVYGDVIWALLRTDNLFKAYLLKHCRVADEVIQKAKEIGTIDRDFMEQQTVDFDEKYFEYLEYLSQNDTDHFRRSFKQYSELAAQFDKKREEVLELEKKMGELQTDISTITLTLDVLDKRFQKLGDENENLRGKIKEEKQRDKDYRNEKKREIDGLNKENADSRRVNQKLMGQYVESQRKINGLEDDTRMTETKLELQDAQISDQCEQLERNDLQQRIRDYFIDKKIVVVHASTKPGPGRNLIQRLRSTYLVDIEEVLYDQDGVPNKNAELVFVVTDTGAHSVTKKLTDNYRDKLRLIDVRQMGENGLLEILNKYIKDKANNGKK